MVKVIKLGANKGGADELVDKPVEGVQDEPEDEPVEGELVDEDERVLQGEPKDEPVGERVAPQVPQATVPVVREEVPQEPVAQPVAPPQQAGPACTPVTDASGNIVTDANGNTVMEDEDGCECKGMSGGDDDSSSTASSDVPSVQKGGDDEEEMGGGGKAPSEADSVDTAELLSGDPLWLVLSQYLMTSSKKSAKNITDVLDDISQKLGQIVSLMKKPKGFSHHYA